jgi:hypothetical protein
VPAQTKIIQGPGQRLIDALLELNPYDDPLELEHTRQELDYFGEAATWRLQAVTGLGEGRPRSGGATDAAAGHGQGGVLQLETRVETLKPVLTPVLQPVWKPVLKLAC